MDTTNSNIQQPSATAQHVTSLPFKATKVVYDLFGRQCVRNSEDGKYTNLYVVFIDEEVTDDATQQTITNRNFVGKFEVRSFVSPDTVATQIAMIFGTRAKFDRVDLRALTPEAKKTLASLDTYGFHPGYTTQAGAERLRNAWALTTAHGQQPPSAPQQPDAPAPAATPDIFAK